MENYAVAGYPVSHSLSPYIFNKLFVKHNINGRYFLISVQKPDQLIDIFNYYSFNALNITSPLKQDITGSVDLLDESAENAEAVNLIVKRNLGLQGYNTDIYGIIRSLTENNVDVKNKKCIILGAGGAAKAAVQALGFLGGIVSVCNRTDKKAIKISRDKGCGHIYYNSLPDRIKETFLFLSAVPEIPDSIRGLLSDAVVFEADYRDPKPGYKCKKYISGLEWLKYQAFRTFEIIYGNTADPINFESISSNKITKIALTGHTGSGKTTYAELIADYFDLHFYDSDKEIEKRTGKKITDIFREDGENYFRKQEKKVIRDISKLRNIVVSVGAGAVMEEEVRDILKNEYFVINLYCSREILLSRLNTEEISKRPLLKTNNVENNIENMMNKRKQEMLDCTDLIFCVSSNNKIKESDKLIVEINAGKNFFK